MEDLLKNMRKPTMRTKRRQIYHTLLNQVRSGGLLPSSKLPDVALMAEHFSVAYATMHSALSDLVREGVLVSHRRKGIFVSDASPERLRPTTTNLVLVLPKQEDIADFGATVEASAILHGCSAGASDHGAMLGILSLPSRIAKEDLPPVLGELAAYDGAIFFGAQYEVLIRELGRQKRHFAMVGGDPSWGSAVTYDVSHAVRMATRHLLDHGYRRIAYFGEQKDVAATKFSSFCEEILARGITDAPILCPCETVRDAYHFAHEFLREASRCDAVFVDNFRKAQTLVEVLRHGGVRIPEDLAVMGFGIESLEHGEGAFLSHVAIPYHEMAREAAEILDLLVRGRAVAPVHKILKARLEIRRSCGCIIPITHEVTGHLFPKSTMEAHEKEGVMAGSSGLSVTPPHAPFPQ